MQFFTKRTPQPLPPPAGAVVQQREPLPGPPKIKVLTFNCEQLPAIEALLKEKSESAQKRFEQVRLYNSGRKVLEDLAWKLQDGVDWNANHDRAEMREQIIRVLHSEANTFVAEWQKVKDSGWNGCLPWDEADAWVEAMVAWLQGLVEALKATKGSVTIEVTPEIERYLGVWGLGHIVYRQEHLQA